MRLRDFVYAGCAGILLYFWLGNAQAGEQKVPVPSGSPVTPLPIVDMVPSYRHATPIYVRGDKPSPVCVLPNGDAILWRDVRAVTLLPATNADGKPLPWRVRIDFVDSSSMAVNQADEASGKKFRDSFIEMWKWQVMP